MKSRCIDISALSAKKSILLLGPRQTGKSTLLKKNFSDALYIDLLESETFREYSTYPERLREIVSEKTKLIIVDEIQRVPQLLNEVHLLIEKYKKNRFILTGSSARTLRRGGGNLLAGRAWTMHLFPFTTKEVGPSFKEADILRLLNVGGLPAIYASSEAKRDLAAYVGTYLKDEIRAESLVRNLERFSRFLNSAAFCSGEVLNFTKIGSNCGTPPRSIIEYFQLLEDTLIGNLVRPIHYKTSRKLVSSSKFYYFDLGVQNYLMKREKISTDSELFGKALEHMVGLELRAYLSYQGIDEELNYWRTHSNIEVDFVIKNQVAVEVKASQRATSWDEKGLLSLGNDIPLKRKIIVCREKRYRKLDNGIEIFPYLLFFKELWAGEILTD